MSAAEKPYDPAVIKDVLCRYFNMSSVRSQLSVQETRFLGLGGPQFRYFRFKLTDGSHTAHAFGKTTLYHDREYRALQYLTTTSPEAQRNASRPIASLQHAGYSFLLLEYLHGSYHREFIALFSHYDEYYTPRSTYYRQDIPVTKTGALQLHAIVLQRY